MHHGIVSVVAHGQVEPSSTQLRDSADPTIVGIPIAIRVASGCVVTPAKHHLALVGLIQLTNGSLLLLLSGSRLVLQRIVAVVNIVVPRWVVVDVVGIVGVFIAITVICILVGVTKPISLGVGGSGERRRKAKGVSLCRGLSVGRAWIALVPGSGVERHTLGRRKYVLHHHILLDAALGVIQNTIRTCIRL